MKIGILGFPKTGKTTVFNALTGSDLPTDAFGGRTAKTNLGKELSISYVIPYMYDGRNRKSKQIHNILIDIFGELVTNPIRSDVRISEAPYHSKSILEYQPNCRGAKDFKTLIKRIISEGSLYQTRDQYSEFF